MYMGIASIHSDDLVGFRDDGSGFHKSQQKIKQAAYYIHTLQYHIIAVPTKKQSVVFYRTAFDINHYQLQQCKQAAHYIFRRTNLQEVAAQVFSCSFRIIVLSTQTNIDYRVTQL